MKSKETKLPLNLQFFAEGDPASEPEKNDPTPTPEPEKKEEEINLATELAQLKAQLAKQKNDFDKVKVLQGKIEEVNELYNQLTNLKNKYYKEAREKTLAPYIQKWNEEITMLYQE